MNKGKKFVSLFLIFSLVVLTGNLMAKKQGAILMVQKKDSQQVRGELIAVKENSLLLLVSGADVSVEIGDIGIITVNRESKALSGFLGGAFTGAVLGYAVSGGTGIQAEGTVLFALPLGLLGLIGGSFAEMDRTFQIGGTSPEEIKKILIKLSKKSRIPDYQ